MVGRRFLVPLIKVRILVPELFLTALTTSTLVTLLLHLVMEIGLTLRQAL
jgi:hypothetical protein